ncbi:hypothetical protein [Erwinia psidii]|uniref:hypothetical protein n=1 Tax=Erwinia psidii TaxID=69224 RepID=UPI0013154F2F|nr:hypothetical protein [Erwinia psidii]
MPWSEGKGFLRLDNVDVSAGTFSPDASGNIADNMATCANDDAACRPDFRQ